MATTLGDILRKVDPAQGRPLDVSGEGYTVIPSEPDITINGVRLSPAEAMTLRVAVASWLMELADNPDCLGDDEHGRFMNKSYQLNLLDIQGLMFKKPL